MHPYRNTLCQPITRLDVRQDWWCSMPYRHCSSIIKYTTKIYKNRKRRRGVKKFNGRVEIMENVINIDLIFILPFNSLYM